MLACSPHTCLPAFSQVWLDGMEVTQFTYFQQASTGQSGVYPR